MMKHHAATAGLYLPITLLEIDFFSFFKKKSQALLVTIETENQSCHKKVMLLTFLCKWTRTE